MAVSSPPLNSTFSGGAVFRNTFLSRIDYGRSINRDLVSAGLGRHDIAANRLLDYYSNRADKKADYYRFNNSGRNEETFLMPHLNLDNLDSLTVILNCRYFGTTSTDEDMLFGMWSEIQGTADSNAQRVIFRYDSDNNTLEFYVRNSADVSGSAIEAVSIEDGEFHVLGARYVNDTIDVFLDGVRLSAGTSHTGPIKSTSNSKVPELMGGHNVTSNKVGGAQDSPRFDLKNWGVWYRGLSDAEMRIVGQDPYVMFRQQPILAGNTQRSFFGGAVIRNGFI